MNPYKYVCDLPVRKTTTAQNSIERALISLLDTNELYELSVKEICQIANVARSTFYAYYNGIDDCVTEIENRFIKDVIEINNSLKCIGKISNIDLSFFENTVLYIKDNKKLLYLFMIKRYNNRFVYKWKDAIKYHLYQRMPEGLGDNNKELTLEIMASQAIGGVKMKGIKIRVLHTGSVCVAPALPFGGDSVNPLKLSPVMVRKSERLWLPVSSYLIEHPKGKILVDCGWHRDMSPNGEFDKSAQIRTLGSKALYLVNQGKVEKGQTVDEQLLKLGITPADLDYVILSHLDCDHANGVSQVRKQSTFWSQKMSL